MRAFGAVNVLVAHHLPQHVEMAIERRHADGRETRSAVHHPIEPQTDWRQALGLALADLLGADDVAPQGLVILAHAASALHDTGQPMPQGMTAAVRDFLAAEAAFVRAMAAAEKGDAS